MVEPVTHQLDRISTLAKVTKADEKNNVCSIQYTDKNGRFRNKDNVSVRLYGSGTDWFPSVGDFVTVEDSNSGTVIIARHVQNYNMDVRSKMQLSKDIYSDSSGAEPGGTIY